LAVIDEVDEAPELVFVLGKEGRVGGELVAGQARVAAFADLPRRQHAVAVGQHPVGALVELEQVVEVARVDGQRAGVGGDLVKAQELALVGGGQRLGVVHRHPRREVPEVALNDMQRDAGVQQRGGAGVPEAVRAAEVDRAEDADAGEDLQVPARVELVAARAELSELEPERGQLGDVVVELTAFDRLDLVERDRILGGVRGTERIEVEVLAELCHRRAQRDEVAAHVGDAVADLDLQRAGVVGIVRFERSGRSRRRRHLREIRHRLLEQGRVLVDRDRRWPRLKASESTWRRRAAAAEVPLEQAMLDLS
jgi:hypothetical protein